MRLTSAVLLILLGCTMAPGAPAPTLEVRNLRCEYKVDPVGIDAARPRLSWVTETDAKGWMQAAYQVLVARTAADLEAGRAVLWDSGRVESDRSIQVPYAGRELRSGERAVWKVRVWGRDGSTTTSGAASWEMGLLKSEDWSARWIGLKVAQPANAPKLDVKALRWIWFPEGNPAQAAPVGKRYFKRTVEIPADRAVRTAVAILTADNEFVLQVNGKEAARGGNFTQFEVADLKPRLKPGANTLLVAAGNQGDAPNPAGVIGQVRVEFESGDPLVLSTDKDWEASKSRDKDFAPAMELAPLGQGPWGNNLSEKSLKIVEPEPAAWLQKTFTLPAGVTRARVYVTALGLYELWVNGKRAGDFVLAPGWTDYAKRVPYQTYDVGPLLKTGENTLTAVVGTGWYGGKIGWLQLGHDTYGPGPSRLLLQLEAATADGKVERVVSDASWKGARGPILSSDLLDGEVYDARREVAADGWKNVDLFEEKRRLEADPAPPIRVTHDLAAIALTEPKPGVHVFDLGQNMVGWARLKVRGATGTTVTMRFAEILNPDGTIYVTNLRKAKCTDVYTLKGGGEEIWEPRFTFHGFRYVELTGLAEKPAMDAVTGRVVTSDTPATGSFSCSSKMLNQLQHNIEWGQRGNFLSIPTDCPQRDERLGWMGDAQIFVRTACYNADVSAFFTKWMRDVVDAQSPDGAFADISPRLTGILPMDGAPAWGDAGVICPWTIYQCYGDTRILEEHYPAYVRWIRHILEANGDLIWRNRVGNNYGDWVSIDSDTPKEILATAYFASSARLVWRIAQALGRPDEAVKYDDLFQKIRIAFQRKFVAEDGRIWGSPREAKQKDGSTVKRGDTQTCYVLALRFDLLPEALRPKAAEYLVADILEKKKGHLSTGFLGVGHLLPSLSESGKWDVAYKLLNNDTFPSWGYSIKHGATTIWERWDGWTAEKGFQDPGMNSFNHYSFGSVGEWMYQNVAGIDLLEPGFKKILFRPRPGGGLTQARGEYESIHGKISSDWKIEGKTFALAVRVPANTTAVVDLPFEGGTREVGSGVHEFSVAIP